MDLTGEDACDKAKKNGMAVDIPEFNNCNINKKVLPLLPDGKHADVTKNMPKFKKQLETYAEHKVDALAHLRLQGEKEDKPYEKAVSEITSEQSSAGFTQPYA